MLWSWDLDHEVCTDGQTPKPRAPSPHGPTAGNAKVHTGGSGPGRQCQFQAAATWAYLTHPPRLGRVTGGWPSGGETCLRQRPWPQRGEERGWPSSQSSWLGNQVQSGPEAQHRPPRVPGGVQGCLCPDLAGPHHKHGHRPHSGECASFSGASGRDRRVEMAPRAS